MSEEIHKANGTTMEKLIVHYKLSFKHLCLATVACPLLALIVCFITAYIFQPNDIHETHCRVYNIIPSISAITGISPQRYLWRISVAFHIGPRFIISAVHRSYHLNLINSLAQMKTHAQWWLHVAFWLNVIETGSLCGVTYISNRENYPVHEKLFIIFMVSSLTHMLACIKGIKYVAETRNDLHTVQKGLYIKKNLLIISLISTVGLVGFFLEHRLLCHRMGLYLFYYTTEPSLMFGNHVAMLLAIVRQLSIYRDVRWVAYFSEVTRCSNNNEDLLLCTFIMNVTVNLCVLLPTAFSMFAFCEYIIALANMAFHITVILDFPTEYLVVAKGIKSASPTSRKLN